MSRRKFAPDVPTDLEVSDDGTTLIGKGQPGTEVEVKDPSGVVIGTVVVGEDGTFETELNPAQLDGETLEVILTDTSTGRVSGPGSVEAPDFTPPDAPYDLEVSDDGTTLTGKGESGTYVEVKDPNGKVIGEGTVDDDGTFEVELSTPQTDGEELSVTLADEALNKSQSGAVDAPSTADTEAPSQPIVVIGDGDEYITADEIVDGKVTVTVMLPDDAVAGDTVSGLGDPIVLTQDNIDAKQIIAQVETPAEGETLEVSVTITDVAGNESVPGAASAKVDTAAPDAPTIETESDGAVVVTPADDDTTEVTVDYIDENGESQTVIVSKDPETDEWGSGNPDVTVDPVTGATTIPADKVDTSEDVTATAKDPAGNTADATQKGDTEAPSQPIVVIGDGDEYITADEIVDGKVTVTVMLPDDAVAGDTVSGLGDPIVLTQDDIDAKQIIAQVEAPAEGETLEVSVTITDVAGNESVPGTASAKVDTTAPNDTDNSISFDDALVSAAEAQAGVTLSGQVEANATVTSVVITDSASGSITVDASDISVDASGAVTVIGQDLSGLADGELTVTMTVTDAASNSGTVTDTTVLDQTPPTVTLDDLLTNDATPELSGTVDDKDATIVVTVDGVDYPATNNGDGTWTLADDSLPALNEGEHTITVTATDPAGNTGTDTATVTVDTTAPSAPTVELGNGDEYITADEIVDGKVTVTVTLPADAVAGDTVKGLDEDIVLTEADITAGTVTGTVVAPEHGEDLDVSVTITDAAGNEGEPGTANATVDTEAPDAPTITLENDTGVSDSDGITSSGTVLVSGLEADATWEYSTDGGDTWAEGTGDSFELSEGKYAAGEVVVRQANAAGNTSDNGNLGAVEIDSTPPAAPILELADDTCDPNDGITSNGTINVSDIEEGATWQYSTDGGDTWVDGEESSFLLPDGIYDEGDVLARQTDVAGNTSDSGALDGKVSVVDEIMAAADNFVDFVLKVEPTKAVNPNPSELDKTGFTVVSAGLGPVLGADVLADLQGKAVQLEVGKDEVRDITVYGQSGGVQVGGTMDLYLYKLNESTNEWEQHTVKENWVIAVLLGGKSKETDFSLGEGQWMFVMASGYGVQALTGYSLKFTKDVISDYADAESVSGTTTGNVLTDNDPQFGYDELPTGTTVTSINGLAISSNAKTVITGEYGKLIIEANGDYTYEVNEDFRGPYGSEDTFTYVVTSPAGNTASADLTIQLNIVPADQRIELDSTVVVDVEPIITLDTDDSKIKNAVGFAVLDLNTGTSILDLELLGGKPPLEFTVGENEVRELTLHGSGGGLAGQYFGLLVYKLDESTGNYVQVHYEKNWFLVVLGGKSKPLTLQFGEGDYKAILATEGGLGLLSGNGLYVDHDKIYDYNEPSKFVGQVTGDGTEDADVVLLKVNDQLVDQESGTATVVQGEYGVLTIHSDGTYTYSVTKPSDMTGWEPPYGKVETFRLVTEDANCKTTIKTLNIKISTHLAMDDINDVSVTEQNIETTDKVIDGVSAATTKVSKDFTVAENTLTSAALKVDTTTLGTRLEYSITNKETGEVVATNKGDVSRSLDVTIDNLAPGNYTIEIKRVAGAGHLKINSSEFTTESLHLDKYTPTAINPVTGVLLENDAGSHNIAELKIGNKAVFVSDPNKGAPSIEIEGLYGTLTVQKNGSYSYKPSGEAYGIETFVYEAISVTGIKETATLEINVGQSITASQYDDIAVSSSADDSFVMGEGADTVVFNNLGGAEGGNGNNGIDTWTDFNATDGDTIDITGLLDGNQTAGNIGSYLAYENGVLMVDRNGNSEFEDLLEVAAVDLNSLLDNIDWQPDGAGFAARGFDFSNLETFAMDDGQDDEPLTLTLEDVLGADKGGEFVTLPEPEEEQVFAAAAADNTAVDAAVLDMQPTVDPLDDLLEQNNLYI